MDRKDDMDLESLKNMLSDVPDTDEFDLDSIICRGVRSGARKGGRANA